MKMYVKNIEYLDESVGEAFITLFSEQLNIEKGYTYVSQPLKIKNNNTVNIRRLDCLNSDSKNNNPYVSNERREYIEYDKTTKKYTICCELIDKDNCIGLVKDIEVHIDGYLPGDCKNGNYIIFNATRIDLDEDDMRVILNERK